MPVEAPHGVPAPQTTLGAGLTPPRSLNLSGAVWGYDPSTRRIALGTLSYPGPLIGADTLSLSQGLPHARLWNAVAGLVPWLQGLLDAGLPHPHLLVVEQPFSSGRHVPHESLHMIGVLQAALWRVFGMSAELMFMSPSVWKSKALGAGHGFAKKPEILAWAREACGFTGTCERCRDGLEPDGTGKRAGDCTRPSAAHDEADALGVATAGAVLLDGRRRIAA